jgi:hypothetical protein
MRKSLSIFTAFLLALLVLAPAGMAQVTYAPPTLPTAEITTSEAPVGRPSWVKVNVRCVAPEAGFVCTGIVSMSSARTCCPATADSPIWSHVRHYSLLAGTERMIAIQLRRSPRAMFKDLHTLKSSVLVTVSHGDQARQQVLLRWRPQS